MSHNVPEGVAYGTVYGEFMSFAADRADDAEGQDGIPDKIPITGYVLFTPRVETVQWPELNPPITAVIQDVRCPVIEGVLYPPGTTPETASTVNAGVVLVATEQPGAVPPTVQYDVTFDLKGTKRQPQSRPINIPSGDYTDLASLRSVTPEPGTVVIVSSEDRILAQEARIAAEESSAGASVSLANAVISATEAAASASSASQSKNDAAEAAQIAVTAEAGAVAARISAEEARDSAQGSATIASTGASSASSSATAAASSATNAATAATNATVAKTGAEAAAVTATQEASAAASSATAAATSATAAASSATAAQTARAGAETAAASISWTGLPGKPAVIGAGASKADARAAIGAADAAATALQDTGWRNIASLLSAGWVLSPTVGICRARRVGNQVTLIVNIQSANATPGSIMTMPAGFRPTGDGYGPLGIYMRNIDPIPGIIHNRASGYTITPNPSITAAGVQVTFTITFPTNDAFPQPAAYPGTPA